MKKLKFFTILFALVSALTASAQILVRDAATELVDGLLISLQCSDTNGGSGYYFNGGNAKNATFDKDNKGNLYVVKGNAKELRLRRLSGDIYVGQVSTDDGALVRDVDAGEAITFTVQKNGEGNFTFSTADGRVLNANTEASTPKLSNSADGASAWLVRKYDAVDLDELGVKYTFAELDKAGVPAVCRVGSRQTTTDVPEGKFLVRGAGGRPGWLHTGGAYDSTGVGLLWNTKEIPTRSTYIWTAEEVKGSTEGEFFLKSNTGYYLSLDFPYFTASVEEAMKFRLLAKPNAEAGVFNLKTETSYLNMNEFSGGEYNNYILTEWDNVNDANGMWEIYPCNVPGVRCSVTYIIKNEGEEVYRATIDALEGGNYPQIPAVNLPAFTTLNYPEGTVTGGEYVLTYTTNLPFKPSTSFDNAKWYAMDVHTNVSNYVVYYDDEDGNVKVLDNGQETDYQNNSATENEQWCFVGNVWDGFKIYNRVAGGEVSLYQPSDEDVKIMMSAEGQAFRVYEGKIANSVAFKLTERSYYINHRGTQLQGWTAADEGSSFRVFRVITEEEQLAEDVEDQLATIAAAFAAAGREYPKKADGVDAANVVWPDEYKNQFHRENGFEDNFELLNYADQAVKDKNKENLTTAKYNLEQFINLSKAHGYPREVIYTVSDLENVNYGTVYMPFNTTCPKGLKLYECKGIEENGYTLSLKATNGNFQLNKAYIIETTDDNVKGKKYQFISYGNQQGKQTNGPDADENNRSLLVGTHDGCDAPAGSYVLQNQNDVLGFYEVESANTIKVPAHKCYLQLPAEAQGVKFLLFPDGTLTSIDAIDAAKPADAATYDLSGRRVSTTTKGLYIVGGKKVLVK